jgi:hypothetical protein
MKISPIKSNIVTIRQGDPRFLLTDGITMSPRAGFEINQLCPREYKLIISECINNGWLKPVAYTYGKQLTMDAMR